MAAKIKACLSKNVKIFVIISIAFFYSTLIFLHLQSRQIILHRPENMMLSSEEYEIYEKFFDKISPTSENKIRKVVPEVPNDIGGSVKVLTNLSEDVRKTFEPRSMFHEFVRKLILVRRNLPQDYLSNSDEVIPGLIRNVGLGNQTCITAAELGSPLTLTKCDEANYYQFWMLSRDKNIRNGDFCLNFSYHFHELTLEKCVEEYQRQEFKYIPEKKQIYFHSADLCMTIIQLFDYQHEVYMTECDDYDENQQWHIDNFDESKLKPNCF